MAFRTFVVDADGNSILEKWKAFLMRESGAKELVIGGKKQFLAERELEFDGKALWTGIDKL